MFNIQMCARRNAGKALGRKGASFLMLAAAGLALLGFGPPAQAATPTEVRPAAPVIANRTFNLRDYGAKGDGRTANDDAFKRGIAAVREAGGGTLVVPEGDYLTGPIVLCSGL